MAKYRFVLVSLGLVGICALIGYGAIYRSPDEGGHGRRIGSTLESTNANKHGNRQRTSAEENVHLSVAADYDQAVPQDPVADAKDGPSSIKLELRRLLLDGRFEELNAILEGYQKAAALDPAKEGDLFTAYNASDIADKSYESPRKAWVHASSKKYQPYAARAEYYYGLGWASRGSQWASETKQKQFTKMTRYFGKSVEDAGRVLQINNQVMVPYCLLIGMTSAHGQNDEASLVVQKALAINPTSYWVRATYLHFIAPRWGGSYKQMQAFIDDAMPYVKQNGKLKLLQGLPYREAGKMDALIKKYSVAERYYTKALSCGDNHGKCLSG